MQFENAGAHWQDAMDEPLKVQQTRSKSSDNVGHAGRSPQLTLWRVRGKFPFAKLENVAE